MAITLTKLVFDPTVPNNGANVGAYLRDATGNLITSTLIGSNQALDVNIINGASDGYFAEDSVHNSGDIGSYVLAVLQGTLSASAGDGDYGSFKTDLLGRLWTNHAGQSAAYGTTTVASTATDIIGTDLANRVSVIIQNNDNKDVFVGSNASVTISTGLLIPAGGSVELAAGPSVNLHAITATGTANIRYFEVA